MAEATPGTTPVTDRRVPPRGVLPRHAQTWLMVALAVGILGIIILTGDPSPESNTVAPASTPATVPSPDRLRDYQDRLRVLDERARQQLVQPSPEPVPPAPTYVSDSASAAAAAPDPLEQERKRREYDSLFASNVVMSRRPAEQRLSNGADPSRSRVTSGPAGLPAPPSIDEVADAVIRATNRVQEPRALTATSDDTRISATPDPQPANGNRPDSSPLPPAITGPVRSEGPLHPVLEGTLIDAVLTNRLDGSAAAPVNCLVTNAVYSHDGRYVLIPAGARILGETKPVQTFGDARLAVSFNRLIMPDGRTHRLDQFMGLNDIGDAGLRDRVKQHYKSTFGASAAVGLISGLAQYLGTAGLNRGNGDRTVVITGGVGDAAAQSTAQVMNRYLNRPPSITIREGHRVKVYVTSDVELPAYVSSTPAGSLLAASGGGKP